MSINKVMQGCLVAWADMDELAKWLVLASQLSMKRGFERCNRKSVPGFAGAWRATLGRIRQVCFRLAVGEP